MLLQVIRPSPDSWLDLALSHHRATHYEDACEALRKAYALIESSGALYDAEIFTRLPLFLQEWGRTAEGWSEFAALHIKRLPGRRPHDPPAQRWLDRATICDKTRLFLQRDGQYDRAILYGIQFYVARCTACFHQASLGQIGPMRSRRAISSLLKPLLEKAGLQALEAILVNEVAGILRAVPDIDYRASMVRTAMLISMHRLRT